MRRTLFLITCLLAGLVPLAACAKAPADVRVYDRTAGRLLDVHVHEGRHYVVGEPGHEYEIRVRNRTSGRLLAVTSVDGVDVVTGRTADVSQGGYVIDPRGSVAIDGWRKSLGDVAAFYFTPLPDSYAARTDRPDDVGVIGVALFRERPAPCCGKRMDRAQAPAPAESEAAGAAADILRESARLGTGHGSRLDSPAQYTAFDRASDAPEAIVAIYYDSRRNLVVQGVLPRPHYARRTPDPFPGGFVPDP
jgi:hypothetical protein